MLKLGEILPQEIANELKTAKDEGEKEQIFNKHRLSEYKMACPMFPILWSPKNKYIAFHVPGYLWMIDAENFAKKKIKLSE